MSWNNINTIQPKSLMEIISFIEKQIFIQVAKLKQIINILSKSNLNLDERNKQIIDLNNIKNNSLIFLNDFINHGLPQPNSCSLNFSGSSSILLNWKYDGEKQIIFDFNAQCLIILFLKGITEDKEPIYVEYGTVIDNSLIAKINFLLNKV